MHSLRSALVRSVASTRTFLTGQTWGAVASSVRTMSTTMVNGLEVEVRSNVECMIDIE